MSIRDDARLDPRLKAAFGDWSAPAVPDVPSRAVLMAAVAQRGGSGALGFMPVDRAADYEAVAPSRGLRIRTETITSEPDGNRIRLQLIRPDGEGPWPCVFYIHGGGMMTLSCFDDNYQAWGRLIAAGGVAVAMVDFRNALRPSSVAEVAPYPAGLNDCLSAFRWVRAETEALGIDASRVVIAGESGGANLAIACTLSLKRSGDLGGVKGLYVLCPYLAGDWPAMQGSSALENRGVLMDVGSNFGRVAYGIEAFEARDPLAWPGFATEADVAGFPPAVVAVNEADPLRDDGIAFYRLLLKAGVPARCRQVMGTVHGTEVYVLPCPDISREAARDLAAFCAEPR